MRVIIKSTLEGTLSKALQKYYTRKGNRLIFSNGMTLNQLAWEMWERLGYREIDPSVLSRVLKGQRLFTLKQLGVFCGVLSLKEKNRGELQNCLAVDLSRRLGVSELVLLGEKEYLLDLIEDNLEKIRKVRLGDYPFLASDWAENVYGIINHQLSKEKREIRRIKWLGLLANLLTENIKANLGLSYANKLFRTVGQPARELKEIGYELKDNNMIGNAYSYRGAIDYVFAEYPKAISKSTKALKFINSVDEKKFALRQLALCYAYEHKRSDYSAIRDEILSSLQYFPLHEQCELLEAIGRADALLGDFSGSHKILREGWDIYRKLEKLGGEYKVARKIQLIRTRIEVANMLKEENSPSDIETIGKEGILLSTHFGYKTYIEKINKLLDKALN